MPRLSLNAKQTGFTLLELMVALAIFSMLAAAGWKIFDGLMKTRDHTHVLAEQLGLEQAVYGQLMRDISQIWPRTGSAGENSLPALSLNSEGLAFNRVGTRDPRLALSLVPIIRVRYALENTDFVRYEYPQADGVQTAQPRRTVLLTQVSVLTWHALDNPDSSQWPGATGSSLPATMPNGTVKTGPDPKARLPAGLEVQFKLKDTPLTWTFAVVSNLPNSAYTAGMS